MSRARAAALMFASAGMALAALPTAASALGLQVYAESPSDAMARYVRILADSPRDFNALVGAGKASLDLGDAQSAAGFFGRAEEVHPTSPIPQAGMGAALVMTGDPQAALIYFARAEQLGATPAMIGSDRGLAYDLLGKHVVAQTDYRAAMNGPDRDEARRRLALSLAITGKKDDALTTLEPLLARGDSGAARCRALVLALAGDTEGAKQTLRARMPGSEAAMGPFFRMLPALSSPQKAAAVNLGIFPGTGGDGSAIASAGAREDRLASIEQLLAQQSAPQQPVTSGYAYSAPARPALVQQAQPARVQLASVNRSAVQKAASPSNEIIETKRVPSTGGGKKIWLQLASGGDASTYPDQFRRIRTREPSLFEGISGFIADEGSRKRLLIGPFRTDDDARLFADALETVRIDSTRWVSQPGQVVRKLSSQ
ncbi:MAG: tetratricopeptide repeat protein [Alphaproteobacteria bacterium]